MAFPALMKLVLLGAALLSLVRPKPPILDAPHGKTFCVGPNWSNETRYVVHADSLGNILPFGDFVFHPGSRVCGRWEFRHRAGRFGYIVGTDTTWGMWFEPQKKWRTE